MTDTDATVAGQAAEGDPASALGRSVAERQRPLRARREPTASMGVRSLPGSVGRLSSQFSAAAGLSLSVRRQLGLVSSGLDTGGLPVVPPAEWDDSLLDSVEAPRTGNATLDHIILTQMRVKAASRRPVPTRGLRSATARRGTRIGRDTGPGASARRLRPHTAPMSRDLEIQRLVSGDGADTRPRASRSGPSGSPGSRSAPGSRPGHQARGRTGRPVPWSHQASAQPTALQAASLGATPGSSSAEPTALQAASLGATPGSSSWSAPVATTEPAAPPDDSWLDQPLRAAALDGVAPPVPGRLEQVAAIAASIPGIGGTDAGATGLHLARGRRGLPPSLHTPRSPAAVGAGAATAVARLVASSAGVVADSPVGGPVAVTRPEAAGPSSAASSTRWPPSAIGAGPGTSTSTSTSTTASSASRASALAPPDLHGHAGRPHQPGQPAPAGAPREPALAAALRERPPSLAFASPPRRAFDPMSSVSHLGPASPPGAGLSPSDATRLDAPRGVATDQLPVASPGVVSTVVADHSGARSPTGFGAPTRNPASVTAADVATDRGLGSVARLLSPASASDTSRRARGSAQGGHPNRSFDARPPEVHRDTAGAVRALRPLPDLASGRGASGTGASLGLPPELLARLAPPGFAPPSGTAPRGSAVGRAAGSPPPSGAAPDNAPGAPPTSQMPVAPPATVPVAATADPGERFAATLERHGGPAPRPLPQRFEPIARAILPRPDRVRIAIDPASRAALAEAGKRAATAGDVVHLARPLDTTPASVDILAHELTHVANPSPLVRFFDDDRDSKEERIAREIGEVMSRAPVGTPPVTPPPSPPAGSTGSTGGGAGAPPAPPPMRQWNREGGAGTPGTGGPVPVAAAAPPGLLDPTPDRGDAKDHTPDVGASAAAAGIDVDRLLDALEARVIRELERRGRRWPRPI